MRIYSTLLLLVTFFSCGSEQEINDTTHTNIEQPVPQEGIIEYQLDENRLSAVEFNNELSLIQQNVYNQINVLFTSDAQMIAQNHDNTLFEIELKMTALNKIKAPNDGKALKKAVKDLLSFYKRELTGSFLDVLPMLELDAEDRTKAQGLSLIDYDEQFAIMESDFFDTITIEQDKFAANNNIKMETL